MIFILPGSKNETPITVKESRSENGPIINPIQ